MSGPFCYPWKWCSRHTVQSCAAWDRSSRGLKCSPAHCTVVQDRNRLFPHSPASVQLSNRCTVLDELADSSSRLWSSGPDHLPGILLRSLPKRQAFSPISPLTPAPGIHLTRALRHTPASQLLCSSALIRGDSTTDNLLLLRCRSFRDNKNLTIVTFHPC